MTMGNYGIVAMVQDFVFLQYPLPPPPLSHSLTPPQTSQCES